jgi:hypothetical protein
MSDLTADDKAMSDRIIDFLKREHSGRDKAIPYRDVMAHFCIPDDCHDNHPFRRLYENRAGSCADGIYYISTPKEALAWRDHIERKCHSAALAKSKYNALILMRPDLRLAGVSAQPGLFGETV